jgi:membrane-associated phospholipid phosphatase
MSQIMLGGVEAGHAEQHGAPVAGPRGVTLVAIGLSLFIAAFAVAFRQRGWEYLAIAELNTYARHSLLLDRVAHAVTERALLQGVVFIGVLWYLWFDARRPEPRARMLTGVAAATMAGIVSRVLQLILPTHPRPLHTAELPLTLPFGVEPDALNHFNSFPSDHGAVWFALALVILRERTALGVATLVWAAIIDVARVYDLFHFPSDIVGSIGLAIVVVTLFDNAWTRRAAFCAIAFEEEHRAWFAMLAFVATFQIATLFDDVREIARGLARVILRHDPFLGG